ncbi:hypothetical protein BH24ACT3_BH24ACT3_11420 [soil metagenome]
MPVRLLSVVIVAVSVTGSAFAGPASAQEQPPPSSSTTTVSDGGGIIPEPNSGREPDQPGDRGGWAQLGLLAVMVGAVVLIAVLIIRSSRRARGGATGRLPPV